MIQMNQIRSGKKKGNDMANNYKCNKLGNYFLLFKEVYFGLFFLENILLVIFL